MHREYHPDDMDHVRAHAFGRGGSGGDAAHDHHHDHDHDDHGPLYVLTTILGVLIAADVVFGRLGWVEWQKPWGVSLSLVAAVLGGSRIVYQAFEGLIRGRIGADVALAQACLAALVIGQPFVAAEVVFIALLGEALEAITYQKAIQAIRGLLDQTPRTARVRREGREVVVPAAHVDIGDIVIVAPGERIAVDGRVIAGRTAVDQAALTGESAPIDKGIGDPVFSGTINQFGAIEIETEKVGDQTTLGQVLKMVAEARVRKSPLERTADRLARYFLPVVEGVAGLTLIAGYLWRWPDVWSRAVAILVVACPCGLVLATPAAVLAATAWMSRRGVIAKGGIAIERLSLCDLFAFDKTGTLTRGEPELASAVVLSGFQDQFNEEALIRIAATAERGIGHPLARAIIAAAEARKIAIWDSIEATAEPGAGVRAKSRLGAKSGSADQSKLKDIHDIVIGNRRLLEESGIELDRDVHAALEAADDRGETSLCVAVDGGVIGILGLRDAVRREAHDVIHDLKHLGIKEIAILTGDRASAARVTAKRVHIKTVISELTPAGKADWIDERKREGRRVAMVGDGINDAPALARADAGIAIGRFGADLAAEAGDFILLGDPLAVLPGLVALSRATTRVIRQNILIFAFGLNAVAMASASLGILGPVAAAILHQAGSLLVLLNAMRLLLFDDRSGTAAIRGIKRVGAAIRAFDDRFDPGRVGVELVRRKRLIVFAILVLAIARYATSGWIAIGADEAGLLRVRGRYAGILPPGLHLRLPEPFERVDAIKPGRLKSVRIGFRSADEDQFTSANQNTEKSTSGWGGTRRDAAEASGVEEALMMTGDGKLVELTVAAQYRLSERSESLRDYAFGVSAAERSLRLIAESVVRREASRRTLDELLSTERRGAIERAIGDELAARVEAYRLGVTIVAVAFQDVRPPLAVVDSFRDVARAESWKSLRSIEGLTYQDERIQEAEGVAATTRARAEAERSSRAERSKGSADAFLAIVSARAAFPALTDLRLFWEAISISTAGKSKVLIDSPRADPASRARFFWPAAPALGAGALEPTAIGPAAVGPANPAIKPKDSEIAIPPRTP